MSPASTSPSTQAFVVSAKLLGSYLPVLGLVMVAVMWTGGCMGGRFLAARLVACRQALVSFAFAMWWYRRLVLIQSAGAGIARVTERAVTASNPSDPPSPRSAPPVALLVNLGVSCGVTVRPRCGQDRRG